MSKAQSHQDVERQTQGKSPCELALTLWRILVLDNSSHPTTRRRVLKAAQLRNVLQRCRSLSCLASLLLFSLATLSIPSTTLGQDDVKKQKLADELDATAKAAAERFPAEMLKVMQEAVEAVRKTGIEDSAKQVGDQAIDGELTGWNGEKVKLSDLWQEGPVVLMWYRGGWCPYCNIQLRAMQQEMKAIEGLGAKLVVLTPELPEKAKETAEANDTDIVALHDKNNELARKYGIVFELPESIVPLYRDRLKLGEYNGNDKMELPLSATYVINKQGKITFAFLDADYKKRAEPSEILFALQALNDTDK